MAALHFEFVSPEAVLFSGDVDQVDLPGPKATWASWLAMRRWSRCCGPGS